MGVKFGTITTDILASDPMVIYKRFDFHDLFDLEINKIPLPGENYYAKKVGGYMFACLEKIEDDFLLEPEDQKPMFGHQPTERAPASSMSTVRLIGIEESDFKDYMWDPMVVSQIIQYSIMYNYAKKSSDDFSSEKSAYLENLKESLDKEYNTGTMKHARIVSREFFKNSPTTQYYYNGTKKRYELTNKL